MLGLGPNKPSNSISPAPLFFLILKSFIFFFLNLNYDLFLLASRGGKRAQKTPNTNTTKILGWGAEQKNPRLPQ
jgi:CRISPR/Cas system CMR subunit Cmr6 (Cas7 group RAMP superfamily)